MRKFARKQSLMSDIQSLKAKLPKADWLLEARIVTFDRPPSFGCVVGERGNSETASFIYSDDAAPSYTDVARRESSEIASVDQNLPEVNFEEASSTPLDFGEISPDHGISTNTSNGIEISATSSSAGHSRFGDDVDSPTVNGNGNGNGNGEVLPAADLKVYTYSDLKIATRNFRSDFLLGEGGFGTVYMAWVDEKTMLPSKQRTGLKVAIKKLNHESVQGFQEWQSEVNFLGRLSHPNLVKLLGYCREDKDLLLVYEFLQKGSLGIHLFTRSSLIQPLSWNLRMKIAIGAARGLAFIHSSDDNVIYRDLKASSILLDGNYNAKISDFRLAKLGPSGGMSHVTTWVMGTYGYAAPEYIATGHLYVKSNVYGFGVVLLEMMTGLRALDNKRPGPQHNLVEWSKPMLPNRKKLKTIMDARIEGQYTSKAAMLFAQLVLQCLEPQPRKRPGMKEVVLVLEQINAMKVKTKGTPKIPLTL